MKSLQDLQKNWEGFAQSDPLWSICADPQKRNNRWSKAEFFATGRKEIETVLAHLRGLNVQPDPGSRALDFGCGVGRLTRAMAAHFAECYGVDISPTMVRLASEYNRDLPSCHFILNEGDRLAEFDSEHFGFIYTSIVLQHIAEPFNRRYLTELIRLLQPGGALVFQVPDRLRATAMARIRSALAVRSRLKRLLHPEKNYVMEMHCMSETGVRALVKENGGQVIDVRVTNSTEPAFSGDLQYLDNEPERGFVSKQYCVVKQSRS
jgi:2-polyprenyl-3-methyl-5-hydroxy-6-metoxy-1,4-benzoquinol methylase